MKRLVSLSLLIPAFLFLAFGCNRLNPGDLPLGPAAEDATETPTSIPTPSCSIPAPGSSFYYYNQMLITDHAEFKLVSSDAEWTAFVQKFPNMYVPAAPVDFSTKRLVAWYVHYRIPGYVVNLSPQQVCVSSGNLEISMREYLSSTEPIPGLSPRPPGGVGSYAIDLSVDQVTVTCGANTFVLMP